MNSTKRDSLPINQPLKVTLKWIIFKASVAVIFSSLCIVLGFINIIEPAGTGDFEEGLGLLHVGGVWLAYSLPKLLAGKFCVKNINKPEKINLCLILATICLVITIIECIQIIANNISLLCLDVFGLILFGYCLFGLIRYKLGYKSE
jgi:hypothetical protein